MKDGRVIASAHHQASSGLPIASSDCPWIPSQEPPSKDNNCSNLSSINCRHCRYRLSNTNNVNNNNNTSREMHTPNVPASDVPLLNPQSPQRRNATRTLVTLQKTFNKTSFNNKPSSSNSK